MAHRWIDVGDGQAAKVLPPSGTSVRVLFASDTPFEPAPGVYIRETIRVIEALGLSEADKDKIYRRNAERVLAG